MTAHSDPMALMSSFVLPSGARWGDSATPLQRDDARSVFSDSEQRRHWIGRARGYAKTTDAAAITLAALLTGMVAPEHPAFVAAGDAEQAALLRDSIEGFVNRTDGLGGRVTLGNWRVTMANGAQLRVMSADGGSAFGVRPSLLVLDELAQWNDTRSARRLYEALITSLAKIPGSRCVIITTAGTPTHWSHKVYTSALKHSDLWRVSSVHGPAPWTSTREIESDRETLGDAAVQRLYFNEWTVADDALIGTEELKDATQSYESLPGVSGVKYAWGVDIGVVNDSTVVAVAHAEKAVTDGVFLGNRVIVDRVWRWTGTRIRPVNFGEVEATIKAHRSEYPGTMYVDPSQARDLVERLRACGIPSQLYDFTATSVGVLASTLLRLFRSRLIWIPNIPTLIQELGDVRLRENSVGTLRMDHVSGGHDDQAVAISLAAQALVQAPTGGRPIAWSDEDLSDFALGTARALGQVPQPVKLLSRAFGGDSAMPDRVIDNSEEDAPKFTPGATTKSPYA
jgi:phage terminase large subunit-like protein